MFVVLVLLKVHTLTRTQSTFLVLYVFIVNCSKKHGTRKFLPTLLLLLLLWPLDGRRKMSLNEVLMLLRFASARLNGSYEDVGVSCGGVVDDVLLVCENLMPFAPGFFVISNALRTFTSRNSRSIRFVRQASMCSRDSSQIGNSASICCLRIFNT